MSRTVTMQFGKPGGAVQSGGGSSGGASIVSENYSLTFDNYGNVESPIQDKTILCVSAIITTAESTTRRLYGTAFFDTNQLKWFIQFWNRNATTSGNTTLTPLRSQSLTVEITYLA